MVKKIIYILAISIAFACQAQQPVIPLYNPSDDFKTNGAYYKDLNNDLSKLEGTWLYENTNNDESIQIKFNTESNHYYDLTYKNISQYQDVLYGVYRYVDSEGNELVNSLADINNFSSDIYQHLINGNFIRSAARYIPCNSCDPNKRIVEVSLEDPQRDYFKYRMQIMHIPSDPFNPERIKFFIYSNIMAFIPEGQPSDHRLPFREEYTLIKQ